MLRRYSQRSADYSTDGDRQYYDDRRYDHSRSALAPCFPLRLLADERVRDRPSSNQQDGWGDAQDDMRQDDVRQDDSSREGHGDRAQSHARAGHSAAASSRRRRPRVRRALPCLLKVREPLRIADLRRDLLRSRRSMMTTAMGTAGSTSGRRAAVAPPGRRTSS